MRNAQAMTSLYVRISTDLNMAMREAVRAGPDEHKNISGFVRKAIKEKLEKGGRAGTKK